MTRMASIAKMGYFPTPPRITALIAHLVAAGPAATSRLLDPCCGEGVAAETLAKAWGLESYGIELDTLRAKAATKRLHKVLQLDYAAARIPPGAFQVLFANPPYSYTEGEGKRLEYECLRGTTKYLQSGGLLVYLVPQYRVDLRMANYLVAHYDQLTAFRFPNPEYQAFKQVVIFGIARDKAVRDDEQAKALVDACKGELAALRVSDAGPLAYAIPEPIPVKSFYIRGDKLDPDAAYTEAQAVGVTTTPVWSDWLTPVSRAVEFKPLMPLKKGHLASVIAAGLMQNLRLTNEAEDLLVKGYTLKVQDIVGTASADDDADAEADPTVSSEDDDRITVRDRFVTEIVTLDLKTGKSERIADPPELAKFIEHWRDALAQYVVDTFKPLYQFDLDAEGSAVNAVLDGLSKGRKVAGRQETGLFPAQRHAAVALWKQLQRSNYALCVGEPGVGKTTIAASVAALRREISHDRRPCLILCPPHLVPKWVREIQEIIPGSQAYALRRVGDVNQFVDRVKANPDTPMFAVISREMAKLGSGWRAAYWRRQVYSRPAKRHKVKSEVVFVCPHCGEIASDSEGENEVGQIASPGYFESRKRKCLKCGAPFYQTSARNRMTPRFPLGDYIAKKYKGAFGLFVADEAHQLKGQSTDQGYALGALIRACGKTLALTGTIYGGRSTSLFYLLHRLSWRVRQEFGWGDGQKWVERFGIFERAGYGSDSKEGDQGYGTFSGKLRRQTYVKEMPGVSPELVMQLLDAAVFLGLPDLGFKLPGYDEYAQEIEMSEEMKKGYDDLELQLRLAHEAARTERSPENLSRVARLTQMCLGWPNSCFRAEVIEGQTVAPALDDTQLFPKEQWLVDETLSQRDRGRKVIVFCRQTGTRDITERLKTILVRAGLRVAVLKASVATDKREAWLANAAQNSDVLLVNPKIVDTGLDLVAYQTIFWYEAEHSLYVLMQATKRIYRVGQVNDVEIYFSVYKNTLENRAVALASSKWTAAQLLYGDSVEGALAQMTSDTGGFLGELAKSMIDNAKVQSLTDFFKKSQVRKPVVSPRTRRRVLPAPREATPRVEKSSVPDVLVPVPAIVTISGSAPTQLSLF